MNDRLELTLEEMSEDEMALMLLSHEQIWLNMRDELVLQIREVKQEE